MNTIHKTNHFDKWLHKLKDNIAKARILHRIKSAELGNFGDVNFIDSQIFEMRIHVGPGYRIYCARQGEQVYLLIIGGDKSTQSKDIEKAKKIWNEIRNIL